jgi:hypothetical protein
MGKQTTTGSQASRIVWDNLEEWVRRKVQEFIQSVLEEEITELLGRQKSERRRAVDGSLAYRNGYGRERRLTLDCGTITLCRPRVRGLEGHFESRVLPLFARRAKGVSKLFPWLYLHGLALRDFDLLRTDAAKRYKKVENATAVIWKMLLLAEQRFQRLDTQEKLMQIYLKSVFRNEETETKQEEVLAIV